MAEPNETLTVYVVEYQHIDYWHSISSPEELNDLIQQQLLPCSLENARLAFDQAGWEGDGTIEAFWIPPFMFSNPDTYGIHVWHVKQSNNGSSFLCANEPYEFPALKNVYSQWKEIEVTETREKRLPF